MALIITVPAQEQINALARKLSSASIPRGVEQLMALILAKAMHFQAVSSDAAVPATYDFTVMPDGTTGFVWCVGVAGEFRAEMIGGFVLETDSRWFKQWMDGEIGLHQLPDDVYDSVRRGPRWGSHT